MKNEKWSVEKYRNFVNSGKANTVRKDDTKAVKNLVELAMGAVRGFFYSAKINPCTEPIAIVTGYTNKRADGDNIFKGIADSLQGFAYKNDVQVKVGIFYENGSEDLLFQVIDDLLLRKMEMLKNYQN